MTLEGHAATAAVRRRALPAAIVEPGVVAIARRVEPERLAAAAAELVEAGIRAVEVTLDSEAALESIARLRAGFAGSLSVGAGTVISAEDAARAIDAGAEFLIAPALVPSVIEAAVEAGVVVMPGAMTPTEIVAAWSAGASAVKLFPAASLGVEFLRALRAPLGGIPLVPTGGVTLADAAAWIAAGAVAVGVGSWLFEPAAGERSRARELVEAVARARAGASA